jgi:hypothetical protein
MLRDYQIVVVLIKLLIRNILTKLYIIFMNPLISPFLMLLLYLPPRKGRHHQLLGQEPIAQEVLHCLAHSGYLEESFVLTAFDQTQQKWQEAKRLPHLRWMKLHILYKIQIYSISMG